MKDLIFIPKLMLKRMPCNIYYLRLSGSLIIKTSHLRFSAGPSRIINFIASDTTLMRLGMVVIGKIEKQQDKSHDGEEIKLRH